MGWYVIFVKTGHEDAFCRYTNKVKKYSYKDIQYSLLVPKRKVIERKQGILREVIRIMFPGYVLVDTESIEEFFLQAKNSPNVVRFLRQDTCFLEVRKEEINQILAMVDAQGVIEISKAFVENDKVIIIEGPLLGMEGTIKKIDKRKGRAKVDFSINENAMLVDLGIEIIKKI